MKKGQQKIFLQIYGTIVLILGLVALAWFLYRVAIGDQLLTVQLLPIVIAMAIIIYLGYYMSRGEQIPIPESVGH